jgi:hypothetical protein
MVLGFAAFFAWLENAGVPAFILSMDSAEPPPTDTAMESCVRIAGLIHGGDPLTSPLEVPGRCLIYLLQHCPSSCAQYTPENPWTVRNESPIMVQIADARVEEFDPFDEPRKLRRGA